MKSKLNSLLIADDHEDFRKTVLDFLPQIPPLIFECNNGLEAIELFEKHRPQMVLMDIDMPKMDGLEATRIIRKRHPDAKIIIVTMHGDLTDFRAAATQVGASGFLSKDRLGDLCNLF